MDPVVATALVRGRPLAIDVIGVTLTTEMISLLGGLAILVLLGLSAFYSSSEIAMFSLAAHRTETLVREGVPGARTVQSLKDNPHKLLVTILVGNNIVNIAMSSIATALLAEYLTRSQSVAVSTFGITTLVLLFGEIAPKSYAVENTESWALRIARPLKWSERLLYPLVVLFDKLTTALTKLTGSDAAIENTYVTREEIREMIQTGEREGVLEEEEREMLQRTLRFNRTIAKEVMTPRLDMDAISAEKSIEEAITECIHSGHTRLPVFDGSLDNVIGIVNIRDLVRDAQYGGSEDVALEDLIEPTLHVPESKNVDELLTEMRHERLHMVIVIDEFGTTEGLVTMEDLTEEIVGEILEGEEEHPIEFVDDDTVTVKGEVNIEEVNEALNIDLPEGEEFETIAGFIFNRAGRLVEEGESIAYDGVDIRVEQVENTRIMKARISRPEPTAVLDDGDGEGDDEGEESRD